MPAPFDTEITRVRVPQDVSIPSATLTAPEKAAFDARLAALEAAGIPVVMDDLDDVNVFGAVNGNFVMYFAGEWIPFTPVSPIIPISLPYNIDGGGAVITTGLKYGFRVNNSGTITGYTLGGNASGSASIAVWKDTQANFPPTVADLILTMTITADDTATVTGLSIAFSAGDWFFFNVGSLSTFQFLMISLHATRAV